MTPGPAAAASTTLSGEAAVGRLFECLQEGLFVGYLDAAGAAPVCVPLAVNARLRALLLGDGDADGMFDLLAERYFADSLARDALLEELVQRGSVADYLVQLRSSAGVPWWVELTGSVDGSGVFVCLVRDVTARRAREDRAREAYQQLARSEQLAAIDRTLADLAHELRNPLAAILGWAERLGAGALDDQIRRGLGEIQSAADRAVRMIRSATMAAGAGPTTRSLVDVNAVVRETVALRQDDSRAGNVFVRLLLDPSIPRVLADAHQIQQILLNLVLNAEHAMVSAHGRGALTIQTRAVEEGRAIEVEVADDGPGVPEAIRSRVFDPFFTTRGDAGGTGLGLAVAQALVREHGGSVRLLENHDGPGAAFVIQLPVVRRSGA